MMHLKRHDAPMDMNGARSPHRSKWFRHGTALVKRYD
jgi:hypothetical protein